MEFVLEINKEVKEVLKKLVLFVSFAFSIFAEGEKLDLSWEEQQEIRNYNLQELHKIKGENPQRLVNQVKSILLLQNHI